MQNIEEHSDNLFRKAAEHYSPKPDEDRWDEIAPQLFIHPAISVAPMAKKERNHKKLFLLLPLAAALLGAFVLNNGLHQVEGKKTLLPSQQLQSKLSESSLIKKKTNSMYGNENTQQSKHSLSGINEAGNNTDFKKDRACIGCAINDDQITADKEYEQTVIAGFADSSDRSTNFSSPGSSLSHTAMPHNIVHTDSLGLSSSLSVQRVIVTKKAKFYTGIITGLAFNQVKNQGFKKAGFDIGLMAGSRISKKLSLEAGIIYSKKSYFSDGRYFNMSKMPANMKVISLTGSSHVLEFPVAVKYNLIQKKSSGVFAVAGLSSYLLTKENNNYVAVINGTQQNMTGSYNKVSAGVASSIHLGVGYEHQLGKQINLRAEPYLQMPLKGIGVGNMQVMSAGVHIALTLPVH